MNVLANLLVVDLARAGFLASGVVAGLEVANLVPAHVDVRDEIAFGDLLVIDIKQNLARRTVDCSTDRVRLI